MRRARALLLALLAATGALAALGVQGASPASAQAAKPVGPLCSAPYHVSGAGWDFCWQLDELRVQGLELNDVKWEGRRVFWKVGLPFSITAYQQNSYGVFKDTLGNSESAGVPGFGRGALPIDPAHCPRWLTNGTLVENGLVCLESGGGPVPRVAAWSRFDVHNYRFVNGYVLHADGSFEPKMLLGGSLIDRGLCNGTGSNGCLGHFHHVYWRFDLDLDGAAKDTIQEFHRFEASTPSNVVVDAPCSPRRAGPWCNLTLEGVRLKEPAGYTKWRVVDGSARNAHGNFPSFELVPASQGPPEGTSSGDAWALAYKGDSAEIGYEVITRPSRQAGDLAVTRYANGEIVSDADVVLWYAEHVLHEPRDEELPSMAWHAVGPRLSPRNFADANTLEQTYP